MIGLEPFASALGEISATSAVIGFGASLVLLALAFLLSCWATGMAVSRRSLLVSGRTGEKAAKRSRVAWVALLFVAAASLLLSLSVGMRYVRDATSTMGFAHLDALMVGVIYRSGATSAESPRVRAALVTDPAVVAAGRSEMLPLLAETIGPANRVDVVGRPASADVVFYRNRVDVPFFEVLGVDLVAGSRLREGRTREVVLSRTAALLFGPDVDDAVGMAVELAPQKAGPRGDVLTVVGVVADVPYGAPEGPLKPVIYTALSDGEGGARFQEFWVVRHTGNAEDIVGLPHGLGGGIEEAYRIATPAEIIDEQFARRSLDAVLAMAGAFAFALALGGVASALARSVASQARQVGVRCALGATEADETRRIAAGCLTDLLLVGAILCGAVLFGRLVAPVLFSIVALPLVFGVLAVLACVCVLGSYLSVRSLARTASISGLTGG